MTTLADLPLALYDEFGEKVKGGFKTATDALAWYESNPTYDLYDEEGEWVAEAPTEYDLRLLIQSGKVDGIKNGTIVQRSITRFDVYPEVI